MEITIHRGADEIGGSCVQMTAGDRSILIDAGSPLGESSAEVDLTTLKFDAVFISHPHKDHYGLIEGLDPTTPVYIGKIARALMDATRIFLGQPRLTNNFRHFQPRQWVEFGDFKVKPFLMDHSCVDAYGFLIEAEGKRVYYSGDFRAHGRKKKLFDWIVSDPPRDVDVLLMEGTMMKRDNSATSDENHVEEKMVRILKTHSTEPCFLICSGQHIDRLCAAFRACIQSSRKLVVDIYTAYVLRLVSSYLPNVPDISRTDGIKVLTKGLTAQRHYSKISASRKGFGRFLSDVFKNGSAIDLDEVVGNGRKYFIKVSNFSDILKSIDRCAVVYSMWTGYLDQNKYSFLKNDPKISLYEIHTSGHATKDNLSKFVQSIGPELLIPIHTEYPDDYKELYKNTKILKTGENHFV